jgi:hypothetical protein
MLLKRFNFPLHKVGREDPSFMEKLRIEDGVKVTCKRECKREW